MITAYPFCAFCVLCAGEVEMTSLFPNRLPNLGSLFCISNHLSILNVITKTDREEEAHIKTVMINDEHRVLPLPLSLSLTLPHTDLVRLVQHYRNIKVWMSF